MKTIYKHVNQQTKETNVKNYQSKWRQLQQHRIEWHSLSDSLTKCANQFTNQIINRLSVVDILIFCSTQSCTRLTFHPITTIDVSHFVFRYVDNENPILVRYSKISHLLTNDIEQECDSCTKRCQAIFQQMVSSLLW
jgi:esterase/lipase